MAVQKQDDQLRTYIQQLCEDTGYCPEDLPRAMNDREEVAREGQGYPCYQRDMMMITSKVNVIVRIGFELAYYDVAVHQR